MLAPFGALFFMAVPFPLSGVVSWQNRFSAGQGTAATQPSASTFRGASPFNFQQVVREAGAKFYVRFDDVGRQQDSALLGGLFERQGMKAIVVHDSFRAAFSAAARLARDRLSDALVPHALIARVNALLTVYRLEHGKAP